MAHSKFRRALLLAAAMTTACAPPVSPEGGERHVVANSLVDVKLEAFDVVSFLDVDPFTAYQTRDAIDVELKHTYLDPGHRRWFFYAFDQRSLDFVVAHFEPGPTAGGRYVAERRLRVKRTADAEHMMGVTDIIRDYEIGTGGIRAGMNRAQVSAVAGRPLREQGHGAQGVFDLVYRRLCVRFNEGRVMQVTAVDACE